jgi:hypothetical protein
VSEHARILKRLAELAEVASEGVPEIVKRALAAARCVLRGLVTK